MGSQVAEELEKLGVTGDAVDGILSSMAARSLDEIETLLGSDCEAVADMRQLFEIADGCVWGPPLA